METLEILVSIIASIVIPLLIFGWWLRGILSDVQAKIGYVKLEIMGSLRLMQSDERIRSDARYEQIKDELKKEISTERHKINNISQRLLFLEGRK